MSLIDVGVADSRTRVKIVATRLFAERGLREVTLREIAAAAGQRNLGVVSYYFGAKEKLVAEILIDGAKLIEARRIALLDRTEASGGPATVREAVEALVLPSVEFSDHDGEAAAYFSRFLLQVSLGAPGFIDETLRGRWNTGYQRCLDHLRRLMPDMPAAIKNQRFVFLGAYLGSLLAQREAMMADDSRPHETWRSAQTVAEIVGTAAALLTASTDQAPIRTPSSPEES